MGQMPNGHGKAEASIQMEDRRAFSNGVISCRRLQPAQQSRGVDGEQGVMATLSWPEAGTMAS